MYNNSNRQLTDEHIDALWRMQVPGPSTHVRRSDIGEDKPFTVSSIISHSPYKLQLLTDAQSSCPASSS